MADKQATRVAYGNALVEFAQEYPELVVLDADLTGSTKTAGFAKKYPERFLNMGIAEGGMITTAAGLAAAGKHPFVNTFAIFASGRAWEQVRNSVAYPHLNVKVVGSHGGLSVGEDGATHQACEDMAIMRAIPGMTVICPCDGNEMRLAVKALLEYDGPAYLRLGRGEVETVTTQREDYSFELGRAATLRDGDDVTIIGNGMGVQLALEAAEKLARQGVEARVVDMHTIKPLDWEAVEAAAFQTGCIVTVEEHSVIGGLGSAVSEYVVEHCPVPVERVGVMDEFGRSGKADEVLEHYGLTAANVAEAALRVLNRKYRCSIDKALGLPQE